MPHILVVDDESGIRTSLNILFTEDGYQVDAVSNGQEAMALLQQNTYDLVLTDIRMPDMDGITLLQQIRTQVDDQLPVIILTAFLNIQSGVEAVRHGANDLLIKPFELEELREAAARALERRKRTPKLH